MPREIKTTLAVDGEQAFKRAINEANTSMKNLGTQLSLASAEFRKDGDAMKLMETRSKALNGQISQQEEIVKALEKAVLDSTKAYGENSDKTEKWEAELNRAKAKLVNLQSELALNEQGLDRSGKAFDDSSQHAADYQATLQTIGKNVSFKTVTDGITGITGTVENAIKKVLGFDLSSGEDQFVIQMSFRILMYLGLFTPRVAVSREQLRD
jgi:chromosome segregation ATPase